MAWTNIFDLAEWDIYIRYNGVTSSPSPDSVDNWVKIEDLDPAVGTVTILPDNTIECVLENLSGSGGMGFSIVAMPVGTPPETASARVTILVSSEEGLVPYEKWDEEGTDPDYLNSTESMDASGVDTYSNNYGVSYKEVTHLMVYDKLLYTGEIPSGEGLCFRLHYQGF